MISRRPIVVAIEALLWLAVVAGLAWRYMHTANHVSLAKAAASECNQLSNGKFTDGMRGWTYWNAAREHSNLVATVPVMDCAGVRCALRIENPQRQLIGVQQIAVLSSGAIYRLSGTARSVATTASEIIFGGRLGLYLPPQPEHDLTWMSECNQWWTKELIFTNLVTGPAIIYVHMGYGNVGSTGEFTDVRLEKLNRGCRDAN